MTDCFTKAGFVGVFMLAPKLALTLTPDVDLGFRSSGGGVLRLLVGRRRCKRGPLMGGGVIRPRGIVRDVGGVRDVVRGPRSSSPTTRTKENFPDQRLLPGRC